jgi:hypothetical protein
MFKRMFLTIAALFTATHACETFQVAPGTGCAWMCDYCASKLGPNYFFTTPVCTYQEGGCVGNPLPSVSYTCCATGEEDYTF